MRKIFKYHIPIWEKVNLDFHLEGKGKKDPEVVFTTEKG